MRNIECKLCGTLFSVSGKPRAKYCSEGCSTIVKKSKWKQAHANSYAKNREKIIARAKMFYATNKRTIRLKYKTYYKKNKENIMAANKLRREKKPQYYSDYQKQYRASISKSYVANLLRAKVSDISDELYLFYKQYLLTKRELNQWKQLKQQNQSTI